MKVSPSSRLRSASNQTEGEKRDRSGYKEAFLVRKAADHRPVAASSRSVSSGPGRWLLREQQKEREGGMGVASAKGVSEGVGVDARRWVEGLLSLTS